MLLFSLERVRAMRAELAERQKRFSWKNLKTPKQHTNQMVLDYMEMQRQV